MLWQFAAKHVLFPSSSPLSSSASASLALSGIPSDKIAFEDGIPSAIYSNGANTKEEEGGVEGGDLRFFVSAEALEAERRYLLSLQVPLIIDPSASSNNNKTTITFGGGDCTSTDAAAAAVEDITYRFAASGQVDGDAPRPRVEQLGQFNFGYASADTSDATTTPKTTAAVLTTPGHTDDHTVLYLLEERCLLTADTVLGSFTPSAASGGGGLGAPVTTAFTCYADYMQSLAELSATPPLTLVGLDNDSSSLTPSSEIASSAANSLPSSLEIDFILPGHGTVVPEHSEHRIRYYISHRNTREAQVLQCLAKWRGKKNGRSSNGDENGNNSAPLLLRAPSLASAEGAANQTTSSEIWYAPTTAAGIVDEVYKGVIPAGSKLVSAAQGNVLHILRKLHREGRVGLSHHSASFDDHGDELQTSPDVDAANAAKEKDDGRRLVAAFLNEADYPLQLFTLPASEAPSEEALLREVYASLGGAGESPPPQQQGAGGGGGEAAAVVASDSDRYSTELVWTML